jgi:EPS-associated MarR family transcriptional regulator
MLTDEYRYRVLKELEINPRISQRALAQALGISLGKANFCVQGLIEKGFVKAKNFKNSDNKQAYAYLLTSRGLEEKACITLKFLKTKMAEYEALKAEIERLQQETSCADSISRSPDHHQI